MSQEKLQVISRPIFLVGGETSLSDPIEGTDLDMSGFVPPSEELDLSGLIPVDVDEENLIPIDTDTMKLHFKPQPKKVMPSILEELGPVAVDATQLVGSAIDALDATEGAGWSRPPLTEYMLRGIIDRYRRRESEIVDSNYVETRLARAQELWKSNVPDDWRKAKNYRIKALAAPYEAARVADEAARLEAALREGRPIPGGLLDIQLGGRAVWGIPDIHGNEWGWWMLWNTPLDDGMTLKEKIADGDFVICLGDAIHPDFEPFDHWVPSTNILLDTYKLKKDHPGRFWDFPGNHNVLYGGGEDLPSKGDTLQGILYRDYLLEKYGLALVRGGQAYVDRSPFFVRVMEGDDVIAAFAHSPVVHGGMTPDDAIISPYDPILRHELTWNRHIKQEESQRTTEADLKDSRRKIGSPHTIFGAGHEGHPKKASFYQAEGMPGYFIGQATDHYNDELGMFRVSSDHFGVVTVVGESEFEGRNLRAEFIDSLKRKKGILRLLDFKGKGERALKAVGGDPLKKPGGKGPANYKHDPVEVSRAMSGRATGGDVIDGRKANMRPMGFWFGTVNDMPLIISADGDTYEIFMNPVHGDAAEMLGAADEIIVEKRDPKAEKPMRMFLHDCMNFMGPLSIFKAGRGLWLEITARRSSGIASRAALYLRHTQEGQARLTIHDPAGFEMRDTEIPRPTRTSTSTAMPPPPPNGKPNGNGPCKFKQDASGFMGIARSMPISATPKVILDDPEYPTEMSALACAGILENSMPGIDAVTVSAMLAVPHMRV